MSRFRTLAVVVSAGVLLLAGGVALTQSQHESSRSTNSSGAPAGAAHGPATSGKNDTKTGAGPIKGATTSGGGSTSSEIAPVHTVPEGLPSSGASSGLPGLVAAPTGPLVKAPLPKTASKRRGLVAGYPARIVPVVPRSSIRSSSVSPSAGVLQVALDARVRASPDDVIRYYSVRLASFGFASAVAPAVGGSDAVTYQRGKDSLVVTVTANSKEKGSSYTVFGTLHSAKS